MYSIEYVKDETGYIYVVYIKSKSDLRDLLNINLSISLSLLNQLQNDKTVSNIINLAISSINVLKIIPNRNIRSLSDLLAIVGENLDVIVDNIYNQMKDTGYMDFAFDKVKVRVKLKWTRILLTFIFQNLVMLNIDFQNGWQ